ncbi:MAG: helix-turn-helix transcriptional regulator [Clostridia bacterium]|nr:helix-turn-helix transcriptional regulator [Clostridia bacterium]
MIYELTDLSFRVVSVYRYIHAKGCFSVKSRPFATLSFRISGTGRFWIQEKTLSAEPGDVLFLPSGVPFEVEYSGSEYLVAELDECYYGQAEVISLADTGEISLLFFKLLRAWNEHRSANGIKSILYAILEEMEAAHKVSEGSPFSRCLTYIEEHFADPALDMTAVCERGAISVSSLQRAFLGQLGVSPMQYVIKLRMGRAARLLREGALSVKEVASLCGYLDEKYFSRAFRKYYGYPPSHLCREALYPAEFVDERHFARMLMAESIKKDGTATGGR